MGGGKALPEPIIHSPRGDGAGLGSALINLFAYLEKNVPEPVLVNKNLDDDSSKVALWLVLVILMDAVGRGAGCEVRGGEIGERRD